MLSARGVQGGQHEHQIGLYTAPRNCRAASFGTGRALRWKANRWVRRDATVDNISSVFSNLFHVAPSRALSYIAAGLMCPANAVTKLFKEVSSL